MNANLAKLRVWWHSRNAGERRTLLVGTLLLGILGFGYLSYSVRVEQDRLRKGVPVANAALQKMQDDATEVDRLRLVSPAALPQGQAMVSALTASMRSHGLDLVLTTEGSDRFRIQGRTSFDPAVNWLAAVQRDYQLRVATLSATRQDGSVKLDAVLILRSE